MNDQTIFWPVLAHVLLTLGLFILLGIRKAAADKAGTVDRRKTALDNKQWPETVVKVSNNIANQFEVPMLFYALCFVLFSIDATNTLTVGLAWLFAVSRYAHAYVHIGSNYVPMRLRLFLVGCLTLIAMLLIAALNMATI